MCPSWPGGMPSPSSATWMSAVDAPCRWTLIRTCLPALGVGAVLAMQVADVDIDDAFIADPGGVPDLGDHALPRVRAAPSTP